jgi:hypothetical protein
VVFAAEVTACATEGGENKEGLVKGSRKGENKKVTAVVYKNVYSKRSHASFEQQHQYVSQSAFRLFALK